MKIDGIDIEFKVVETLGGSPAKCRIDVPGHFATIRIAKDKFRDFDHETRMFVILHEVGHAVLNTGDEEKVDQWAFRQYAKTKLSLANAVFAISKVLDPVNNPEHSQRTIRQFYRAKHAQFLRGKTSWNKFLNQKHKE